jgi:hypothetical protein
MLSQAIHTLNPVALIVVSIIGFAIGGLWYSPLLFAKAWMAEMKFTEESMKRSGSGLIMFGAFILTILTVLALAMLASALQIRDAAGGAKLGLFAALGFVFSRTAMGALFERRSRRLYRIQFGHDLIFFVVTGAILGVWR